MDDFCDSVNELKELKESLADVDEKLAECETSNTLKLDQLNKDFTDNKIKAVSQAVADLGKVIISKEELNELKESLKKLKNENEKCGKKIIRR